MDDDQAVILMVDSNLQRESILPSERAFAYKMKLEAIKNQGARSDLTSAQLGPKLTAAEKVALDSDDSKSQVKRFIRLTNLIPELLELVDQKKISFNPAVELSYLTAAEQRDFLEAMQDTQNAPSLSQAQRIKKLSQEGKCSYDAMFDIMGEEKKAEMDRVTIKTRCCRNTSPNPTRPSKCRTPSSSCWSGGRKAPAQSGALTADINHKTQRTNLEESPMNKTKPTLAQQTYEKVCAIESILNRVLADNSAPVPDPSPVSERPLYLATASPRCPSRLFGWRTLTTICPASTRPICSTAFLACPS